MALNMLQRSDVYMSERGSGPAILFLHGAPIPLICGRGLSIV